VKVKTTAIHVRVSPAERSVIQRAAKAEKKNVSVWLRALALKAAGQ
jgi:uncharacterized protein (DUF1778 family)